MPAWGLDLLRSGYEWVDCVGLEIAGLDFDPRGLPRLRGLLSLVGDGFGC